VELDMVKVLVPLFIGFEEIEAITIIDILRRAEVEVVTAGLSPNPVRGAHGIPVIADLDIDAVEADSYAGIVLPGGAGTATLRADSRVRSLVMAFSKQGKTTAAVCAAPTVLSELGLLKDKKATSYPSVRSSLIVGTYLEDPVVVDDLIITSRGAGTAMAFALELAARFSSPEKAQAVARAVLADIDVKP
jgi:protein deglycase